MVWRRREEHAGEIMESKHTASRLLMLSCGTGGIKKTATVGGRVFECTTCNQRFPTFQALEGHRTSHKRVRVGGTQKSIKRVHECPICGLEFPLGQALGGHMRRHKPAATSGGRAFSLQEQLDLEKKDGVKMLLLDLNLPPLGGEMEVFPLIDFFGLVDS